MHPFGKNVQPMGHCRRLNRVGRLESLLKLRASLLRFIRKEFPKSLLSIRDVDWSFPQLLWYIHTLVLSTLHVKPSLQVVDVKLRICFTVSSHSGVPYQVACI